MAQAPSRDELEDLSAGMSGVNISRHQPKRVQSTTTPASAARPRALRKLHDDSQAGCGSDSDFESQDKENFCSTPRGKHAAGEEKLQPQGVTPSRLACLGDLKDELTCCICLDVCVRPVTTPCGHNFCRACLTTAQLHSSSCAKCREVLPRDFSLKVNTALWNTIRLLFPAVGLAPLTPLAPPQAAAVRRTLSSSLAAGQAFRRPRPALSTQQQQASTLGAHTQAPAAPAVPTLRDSHSQLHMLLELLDTEPAAFQPLSGHAHRSSHSTTTTITTTQRASSGQYTSWPVLRPLSGSSGRAQSAALQATARPATVSTTQMYSSQLQPLSLGAAMPPHPNSRQSSSVLGMPLRRHNSAASDMPRHGSTGVGGMSRASSAAAATFSAGAPAGIEPAQRETLLRRSNSQTLQRPGDGASGPTTVPAEPVITLQRQRPTSQNGRGPGLLGMLASETTGPVASAQQQLDSTSHADSQMLRDVGAAATAGAGNSVGVMQAPPQNPFLRSASATPGTQRDAGFVPLQMAAPAAATSAASAGLLSSQQQLQQVQQRQQELMLLQQQNLRPFARPSLFQRSHPTQLASAAYVVTGNERGALNGVAPSTSTNAPVPAAHPATRPLSAHSPHQQRQPPQHQQQPQQQQPDQAQHYQAQQQEQQWGNDSEDSAHDTEPEATTDNDSDDDVTILPTPQPPARLASASSIPPARSFDAHAMRLRHSLADLTLPLPGRQSHLRDTLPRSRASTDQSSGSGSLLSSPAGTDGRQQGAEWFRDGGVVEDTLTPVRDQNRAARPFVRSPDSLPGIPALTLVPALTHLQKQQQQQQLQAALTQQQQQPHRQHQHQHQATATATAQQHQPQQPPSPASQLQHYWQQQQRYTSTQPAGWDTASALYAEPSHHSTATFTASAPTVPTADPSGRHSHGTEPIDGCSEEDEDLLTLDSLDLLSPAPPSGEQQQHLPQHHSPMCDSPFLSLSDCDAVSSEQQPAEAVTRQAPAPPAISRRQHADGQRAVAAAVATAAPAAAAAATVTAAGAAAAPGAHAAARPPMPAQGAGAAGDGAAFVLFRGGESTGSRRSRRASPTHRASSQPTSTASSTDAGAAAAAAAAAAGAAAAAAAAARHLDASQMLRAAGGAAAAGAGGSTTRSSGDRAPADSRPVADDGGAAAAQAQLLPALRQSARLVPGLRRPSAHAPPRC
ncbi:MAG: hypothetical protein WDW38_008131 [Sanguina aurantia]